MRFKLIQIYDFIISSKSVWAIIKKLTAVNWYIARVELHNLKVVAFDIHLDGNCVWNKIDWTSKEPFPIVQKLLTWINKIGSNGLNF